MPEVQNSILDSVKKSLGVGADDTSFDVDIIMHINSVFGTLNQLGVGPLGGFEIEDNSTLWSSYITDKRLNPVKTYIYLRVRLLFDPPTTGYTQTAFEKQIQELEWRLNVQVDKEPSVPILETSDE